MPAGGTQRYYPGGSRITTEIPVASQVMPVFGPMLPPPVARPRAPRVPQVSAIGAKFNRATAGSAPQVINHKDDDQDPLKFEKERALRAQLRAISEPQPMRMTTFASGANNYWTPDTSAMTGAQRQVFLPQGSGFENGGGVAPEPDPGGYGRANAQMQEAALRQEAQYPQQQLTPQERYAMQLAQAAANQRRR